MNQEQAQKVVDDAWRRVLGRPPVLDPKADPRTSNVFPAVDGTGRVLFPVKPEKAYQWKCFRGVTPDGSELGSLLAGIMAEIARALGSEACVHLLHWPKVELVLRSPYAKTGDRPGRMLPPFYGLVEEYADGADYIESQVPYVLDYVVTVTAADVMLPPP